MKNRRLERRFADKMGYPSGGGRRFLRALGLGIFQHAANRHDQHNQHGGADQQRDGAAREQIRQHIQLVG